MFKPISNRVNLPEVEEKILGFWQENKTFQASLENRRGNKEFVFYDGPPFATGLPHYGHLLAGTIKDIIPRYQTMRGYFVDRRFGWDCHGLPVEYEVEGMLDISGKTDIEDMGVDIFNEKCRSIVLRYTAEWEKTVTRMGRWVDFERQYKTMDAPFMESIWWVFKALWDKGLIYEGRKILPCCPRCSTPLSNFETNQGYMDVVDPAITVRFKLDDEENAYVLAWTTTPWTLPSNMALAAGPDITYLRVQDDAATYYMAKARFGEYYKDDEDVQVTEVPASDLIGRTYEPLFPYFSDLKEKGAFRIIAGEFVTTEDGTGIVHIAPGFGEDDYAAGIKFGIPVVCPVDVEGKFTEDVSDYAGRKVKEADKDIIRRLKEEGKLVKQSTIKHSYPHCWRCDTALIYRGISTWFVNVEKIKPKMLAANSQIHWVPSHLRDGRFGKWLEGARDWAISRNRFWGTPLPIWRSDDGKEVICVGSIAELEELSGRKVDDLHKHFVDNIEIPSREGRGMLKRVTEVLDCWFESGSMPYAQNHYPFENKEHFETHFPADFIAEGLDQTRGWFYTLTVLAAALFDRPAFKNVIVNGLVLAEDGKKMSKRLSNYPDPKEVINTYGADAIRLYMINSGVVHAENLRFSEDGVKQLTRNILIPLWNAYSFFVTYANIDNWSPDDNVTGSDNVLDRWICSSLETLSESVVTAMDNYDLQKAVRPFVLFIDDLTNWYIRRSRRRFWKSQDDNDKLQAYTTLYNVLLQLSKIAAPFIPFISEEIYRNLRSDNMPESVHLCDFPLPDASKRDSVLEEEMELIMTVVRLGRLLRSDNNLKVRQPLAQIHVISGNKNIIEKIKVLSDIVLEELNVKDIVFGEDELRLATLKGKPDFKKLGPRLGADVKKAAAAIAGLDSDSLAILVRGGEITINIGGKDVVLSGDDVIMERIPREGLVVASEGELLVALETELSDDLILEGLAREFVNKTQNMRKNAGLEVTRRIKITFTGDELVRKAVENMLDYIKEETLCDECVFADTLSGNAVEWELNGYACSIDLSVVD